jgi:hypothetical protein
MQRFPLPILLRWLTLGGLLGLWLPAQAQVTLYYDRSTFLTALAGLPTQTEDYESYSLGDIPEGSQLGHFTYTFDPTSVQPAIVSDGAGRQALGGSPYDVFVGGDSVTLTYHPLTPLEGPLMQAFGADFAYAPSGLDIPADTYRLGIGDGPGAGAFAGNLLIPFNDQLPMGGTFFLGVIGAPGVVFTQVNLFSVQTDPDFLVPAYQVDNLVFAPVPEPGTLSFVLLGSTVLTLFVQRRKQRSAALGKSRVYHTKGETNV